jgi:hypothetical protein
MKIHRFGQRFLGWGGVGANKNAQGDDCMISFSLLIMSRQRLGQIHFQMVYKKAISFKAVPGRRQGV